MAEQFGVLYDLPCLKECHPLWPRPWRRSPCKREIQCKTPGFWVGGVNIYVLQILGKPGKRIPIVQYCKPVGANLLGISLALL